MNGDVNEIASIIENLVNDSTDKIRNKTFKRGIIDEIVTENQYCSVFVEGNSTSTPDVLSLASYKPFSGDKVLMVSIGSTGANLLILGSIEASPPDPSTEYVKISEVIDFNNYVNGGKYVFVTNSSVASSANRPTTLAGWLEVLVLGAGNPPVSGAIYAYAMQRYTTYQGATFQRGISTNGSGAVTRTAWTQL